MEKRVTAPLTLEQVKDLKCGDSVLISGVIYTARDAAHKRLCELVEQGKELPFRSKGFCYLLCRSGSGKRQSGYRFCRSNHQLPYGCIFPNHDQTWSERHDRKR